MIFSSFFGGGREIRNSELLQNIMAKGLLGKWVVFSGGECHVEGK
jgi:hypothetical protein